MLSKIEMLCLHGQGIYCQLSEKMDRKIVHILCLIVLVLTHSCQEKVPDGEKSDSAKMTDDPLPSWNNNQVKQSILAYVQKVTDTASGDFIPLNSRIATFDNDGTLWAERPYVQELFALYKAKKMVEENPALGKTQPFQAVINKDKEWFAKGGEKALLQLLAVTHTGMKEDEFETSVDEFFQHAKYPGRDVTIDKIVYQPQLELLTYLRKNGFKVFICTGGTVEFVRSVSNKLYGVPKEQVIGTTFKYRFVDSTLSIQREPAAALINDKEGKPVGIQQHIGARPVFACGNEGGEGDIAMLRYSQGNRYPSFQMIINHDDSTREYYYQEKSNASLNAAAKNNWHVVSMKQDWKKIFND
jgi:hypothetical protein